MKHRAKNHRICRRMIIITTLLLLTANLCWAQGGAQADSFKRERLPIFEWGFMVPMIKASGNTHQGVGVSAVFNPHPVLSLEIEADHIFTDSRENRKTHPNGGPVNEVFGGVKSGYRFHRVGLFAKARPGYLSFQQLVLRQPLAVPDDPGTSLNLRKRKVRRPALNVGMVFEFYLTRHWAIRTDMADTIVFYSARKVQDVDLQGVGHYNFQTGFGIQFRF